MAAGLAVGKLVQAPPFGRHAEHAGSVPIPVLVPVAVRVVLTVLVPLLVAVLVVLAVPVPMPVAVPVPLSFLLSLSVLPQLAVVAATNINPSQHQLPPPRYTITGILYHAERTLPSPQAGARRGTDVPRRS